MGQVCAHTPRRGFSGMASHADFVHGAAKARGGKMIIALESTRERRDGVANRVPPERRGRGRGHVLRSALRGHGIRRGLPARQEPAGAGDGVDQHRPPGLSGQTAPGGHRAGYVQFRPGDGRGQDPRRAAGTCSSAAVLDDGTLVSFRPMHPTDEPRVRDLFHSLSKQTMYYRFMSNVARLPQRQIQNFVYVDYRERNGDCRDDAGGVRRPDHRRRPVLPRPGNQPRRGRLHRAGQLAESGHRDFLLKYLATIARGQGIAGFTAEVLVDNMPMLAVLRKSGFRLRSRLDGRVHSVELDFE